MQSIGFIHSPFKNAVRPNRPIVIEGLDEKLVEHYENWKRMEKFLFNSFEENKITQDKLMILFNDRCKEIHETMCNSHRFFNLKMKRLESLVFKLFICACGLSISISLSLYLLK